MVDIVKAGMTQLTYQDGTLGDWVVSVGNKELFKLSKNYGVAQMFEIRDTIKKMMDYAYAEGMQDQKITSDVKLEKIVKNGDSKLDLLKEENIRLSTALRNEMIKNLEEK